MDLGKLRRGELIAAAGGILLLIALFFVDWYSRQEIVLLGGSSTGVNAWDDLGFFGAIANLVILAAAISAVTLAILEMTSRSIALPVAASAITATLGFAAVGMILLRILFQPGPNALTDIKFGIVLALIAAGIVAYGGWESMKEEGTTFDSARDQLQSRYSGRAAPEARPRSEPVAAPSGEPEHTPPSEPGAADEPESRPPPPTA
jgi:hypothetical protein